MKRRSLVLVALLAGATALLARPLGRGPIRLEIGAFEDGLIGPGFGRADRLDVDPQAATDGRTSFYFRASPENTSFQLPVVPMGKLRLLIRGSASVRSGVSVFAGGRRVGEVLVLPGTWSRYSVEVPADAVRGKPLELKLALRPLPLVRGEHAESPRLLLDFLELECSEGFRLSPFAWLLLALVPFAFWGFGLALGVRTGVALGLSLAGALLAVVLARLFPFPLLLALPRLVPVGFASGWLAHRFVRRSVAAKTATLLAGLVAAGVVCHGSLAFFPNHNPPDLDIHVRRTLDLAGVGLDYQSLLRYSSQLPTASQDQGAATAALGERTLIPYSPLPYFFYYALQLLGLDLYWAMTVSNAALAMLVAPVVFLAGRRLFDEDAGWIAALLYSLDLAVWHHLGRSHAPAVFGFALCTAALLLLACEIETLGNPRRVALVGTALCAAALGYSSLAVLFGLFGVLLLVLLAAGTGGLELPARRGAAVALLLGGMLAGALFYFHFVPGLLGGARGVEAEPDLFPGRTVFIFHNESRQSLRLWVLGYAWPLFAGLLAAPLALHRARPSSRPVLAAWLGAWAAILLLKEPVLLPKLLRWAKEDQFLSPLLCLLVGAACAAPARRSVRLGAAGLAVLGALWLALRDFAKHANSLQF